MKPQSESFVFYQAGIDQERDRMRFLIDMRLNQLQNIPTLKNRQQLSDELLRIRQYCDPC